MRLSLTTRQAAAALLLLVSSLCACNNKHENPPASIPGPSTQDSAENDPQPTIAVAWSLDISVARIVTAIDVGASVVIAEQEKGCPMLIDLQTGKSTTVTCRETRLINRAMLSANIPMTEGDGVRAFDASGAVLREHEQGAKLVGATDNGWFDGSRPMLDSLDPTTGQVQWSMVKPAGFVRYFPGMILARNQVGNEIELRSIEAESGKVLYSERHSGLLMHDLQENPNCALVAAYWSRPRKPRWRYEFFDKRDGRHILSREEDGLISDVACTEKTLAYVTWNSVGPSALAKVDLNTGEVTRATRGKNEFYNAKVWLGDEMPWVTGMLAMRADGTILPGKKPPAPVGDLLNGSKIGVVNGHILFSIRHQQKRMHGSDYHPATISVIDLRTGRVLMHEEQDRPATQLGVWAFPSGALIYLAGRFTMFRVR